MTKEERAELHNVIVQAIVDKKSGPQDVLYVLELIKQEILTSEMKNNFAPRLSDKKPLEMK